MSILSRRSVYRAAVVVSLVGLWEVVSLWVQNPTVMPTVDRLLTETLPEFGIFGQPSTVGLRSAFAVIAGHSWITALRVLQGLAVGLPIGVGLGVFLHLLRGDGPLATSSLLMLRSVPLLALIPLFAFWFGASDLAVIAFIVFGVAIQVSSDTYEAGANVSPSLVQLGYLLGARRARIVGYVYLPALRPALDASVERAVISGWALSLGAEYVSSTSGLGYLTYQSYLYSGMGKLAILAAIYMLLGYASLHAVLLVQTIVRGLPALAEWSSK